MNPGTEASNRQHRQFAKTSARLKDSCDNCAQSKVKCDRVRSNCQRCGQHVIACHYSVARTMGRAKIRSNMSTRGSEQGSEFVFGDDEDYLRPEYGLSMLWAPRTRVRGWRRTITARGMDRIRPPCANLIMGNSPAHPRTVDWDFGFDDILISSNRTLPRISSPTGTEPSSLGESTTSSSSAGRATR